MSHQQIQDTTVTQETAYVHHTEFTKNHKEQK